MEENKNIEEGSKEEGLRLREEEIISTPENPADLQPSTLTLTPLTPQPPDMEVHKHPHHITHKKKWGEYFLEFLMLFLAVFLGFLAENIREHLVEKEKEKQYIESLVEDLKTDQQSIKNHVATVSGGILMMDTLIYQLSHPATITEHSADVYYLARFAPRLKPLPISNRTYEQLKNSGSFRLIRNLNVSNKIMNYYENLQLIRLLESVNETEFTEYKKAAAKIFDPAIFVSMEGKNNEWLRLTENPTLRTTDKNQLQELAIFTVYMHGTKKGVVSAAEGMRMAGDQLIKDLETEYHLK